jgi:protein CMS1
VTPVSAKENLELSSHADVESIDALGTSALTHIMLDVSFRDAKKRSLLDIPETRDEVFKLVLGAPRVAKAIQEGKLQVVLF